MVGGGGGREAVVVVVVCGGVQGGVSAHFMKKGLPSNAAELLLLSYSC